MADVEALAAASVAAAAALAAKKKAAASEALPTEFRLSVLPRSERMAKADVQKCLGCEKKFSLVNRKCGSATVVFFFFLLSFHNSSDPRMLPPCLAIDTPAQLVVKSCAHRAPSTVSSCVCAVVATPRRAPAA